jgi:hypothetical protein
MLMKKSSRHEAAVEGAVLNVGTVIEVAEQIRAPAVITPQDHTSILLNEGQGGPRRSSRHSGEEIISWPCRELNPNSLSESCKALTFCICVREVRLSNLSRDTNCPIFIRGSVVDKALCYNPEGHVFET